MPIVKTTKAQALVLFESIDDAIIEQYGKNDKAARRQGWNDFVDGLQKDEVISGYQAKIWVSPIK